jgi:hypothetical protein
MAGHAHLACPGVRGPAVVGIMAPNGAPVGIAPPRVPAKPRRRPWSRQARVAVLLLVGTAVLSSGRELYRAVDLWWLLAVTVTTPYPLGWELTTSLHRLLLQLWPSGVFLYCLVGKAPGEVAGAGASDYQ